MDHEYDVLCGYIPSFVQHLKDTGSRLGLRMGSQANEDQINAEGVEVASEAHDPSSWTPAEYDAFFRALAVHSRWRPDLIAACVPTKTEWEVWMYLEALEGAANLTTQQDGEDEEIQVDRAFSDSDSYSGSNKGGGEDSCEPALEVSQAWIDVEERMVAWIVHAEHLAAVEDGAPADTKNMGDEPPKRKRGRPRGTGKVRARSRVRGSNKGCETPPPVHHSPSPETTSTPVRKREALMARLEFPHLLVLDSVLREGEEAMREGSKSREASVTTPTLTQHGDERVPRAHDLPVEASNLSDRTTAPQQTSNASNAVIDPILLAVSGDPAGGQSDRGPSESTSTAVNVLPQGPSSLPSSSTQPTSLGVSSEPGPSNTFTFSFGNVTPTNPDPAANAESDLSLFSPRSRRRIQKRLYMRRKRALLRENGTASEGAIDTGIEKLRPGKKVKSERSETLVVSTPVPCSEEPSDADLETSENMPKKKKCRGLTLPYKLKAQFAELGIDVTYLRKQGMDLLNLSALGKLMGLCYSLEHDEEDADGSAIAQSIDAQLIRRLQAALVMFVTDIIHRAIVWREREARLKRRSRAWRHSDQITIGAVEHAVEAIGARYHSHKEYFKALEALHSVSSEPSSASSNASEELDLTDVSIDPDAGAADRYAEPPELSLHRDLYTPLIYPPSAWRMGPLACLSQTYGQEAMRTRRGTSAEMAEEELMSDQTNEEELEAELKEEDEIDISDMQLAATHERHLWNAVRIK